eukprot:PhF_6_TR35770/c0_g1_i1/m.51977/K06889/K06889; uncharacterized protein
MIEFLQAVLFIILTLIVALGFLSYYYRDVQNKMLYMNESPPESRASVDLPTEADSFVIPTPDGVELDAYTLRHPSATRTVIHFHGNAGNIGHRVPLARHIAVKTRGTVVMVDYRGYGRSSGTPTEEGLQ